jgi:hypothetical protein
MEEQPSNLKTPKWLKHLQENSWEAEILISGGAIFSLFQLVEVILKAGDYLHEISSFNGLTIGVVILILITRGVTIGFILHLFLRGFWIGLVCLRSVFPFGINFSKLRFTNVYLKETAKVNLTNQIILLDKFSGIVFFGSFLFAIAFAGLIITGFALGNLWEFIHFPLEISFSLFGLYLIDLFTFGLLRRNKWIGNIYLPVYWFFNIINLSFIYRPYLQIVSSNIPRWKVSLFFIFLLLVALVTTIESVNNALRTNDIFDQRNYLATAQEAQGINRLSEGRYLDKIPAEEKVRWACVQSDLVKDDYLKLFIPYLAKYDLSIATTDKKVFSEIVSVSLNDSIKVKPDWFTYERKSSNQYGIISYILIDSLPKGKNQLIVEILGERFYHGVEKKLTIPFWK